MGKILARGLATITVAGLLTVGGPGPTVGAPLPTVFDPKSLPPDLRSISVQNVPIVYSDQGSGDPLIVLTPYPFSARLWTELSSRLSASARVIVVEPPGIRAPASMKGDYSSLHLLYLYRDFVKGLGLTNVYLLGVGEAGGLAVAFGHHFPEITTAVVSINGFESVNWTPGFEGTLNYFKQSADGGLPMLLSSGSLKYREKQPSREEMERLMLPLQEEDQRNAVRDRFKAYANDVREGYVLAMLPNFNRHLLLLRAEDDHVLQEGEKLVQRTRGQIRQVPVEYQVISKSGHFAFLDQPEKVVELIRAFLARNPISK
ncbi:MAG: alpha/beta hydrolase [Nitrospirae bacterium]|nr:alpha/beta hydrolase [Nitrospirota bacterium]